MLADWFNQHAEFFYQYMYGDKDTFRLAWDRVESPYAVPPLAVPRLACTISQNDFQGRLLFQHRCSDKWSLSGNRRVPGFRHESDCLERSRAARPMVRQVQRTPWPRDFHRMIGRGCGRLPARPSSLSGLGIVVGRCVWMNVGTSNGAGRGRNRSGGGRVVRWCWPGATASRRVGLRPVRTASGRGVRCGIRESFAGYGLQLPDS